MERTISGMMGKGSINHNTRAFQAKNVDKERSSDNVCFRNENIKEVYHQLFDEALECYNAKQKRNDRKIDNYYEKIRQSKQEKLFYEAVFQIGNKDDMNAQSQEGRIAKEILSEFMEDFQKRNPNLHVFSAHLHMDEETPHLHIDFVPFICGSKRGLDTRVSLKGALGEMSFQGGTRGATEWNQWIESEKQELAKAMERHGVRWKQLGTHNKHLSVLDYEKQERAKEVAYLEKEIIRNEIKLSEAVTVKIREEGLAGRLREENKIIRDENIELSSQNNELAEEKKQLLQEKERLKLQQQKLHKELEQMQNSKEVLERNVRVYDEEPKWQLPEVGAFMSASSYRDNKVLPLVNKLKEIVKNLTIKCVQLMEEVKKLTAKVANQEIQISRMTDKLMEQNDTIGCLQEKAADLERVKRFVGAEKVDTIVRNAKELEQLEQKIRQPKRAYDMSR